MKFFVLFLLMISGTTFAEVKPEFNPENRQDERPVSMSDVQKAMTDFMASKWYERVQIRGYTHFRYNRLLETNNKLVCSTCDSSIGDKQGFFLRRSRLTFYGDVNDKVYFYIQPDFATTATGPSNGNAAVNQQNYVQIRDAYFDYHLTEDKEWRIRAGIQKVIYGYENMVSSSNRLAFDRSDAINGGAPNERDVGLTLMYSPTELRRRFKDLANSQYKGTGDYGMLAVSVYNGQSLNRAEKNNDLHRAIRATYPFKLKSGQFIEASVSAYAGKYNAADQGTNRNFYDGRQAVGLHYFPQPFGFQAEWTTGMGPEFDPVQNKIRSRNLRGGYAIVNYQMFHKNNRYLPYVRYQEYKGGYKLMKGETLGRMHEWEFGLEWQPHAAFELQVAYGMQDRIYQTTVTDRSHQLGNMLRVQAQFNY